ncbi:MAG TPA: ABC transporter permease, partial [Alphaproteobacteria bacterium]|nr:ABC transporter permease [Alphaproteobacteria bacterium]
MLGYVIRRIIVMIPTLFAISAISFAIIQLPPGDYLTTLLMEAQSRGGEGGFDINYIDYLRERYALDRPIVEQYFFWLGNVLHGDFGYSLEYKAPVTEIVGDRLFLTVVVAFATTLFI